MTEAERNGQHPLTPPYGPTKGMMQAIQLLRKSTPPRIDGKFLRMNKVAPGNEYKVIGALRFLGLIDDEGRPTERSRLLKTKGPAFTAALQQIVRSAYRDVFRALREGGTTQEDIYNYFVAQAGLGPEMAAKTTRFFIQLCQLAEIDLGLKKEGRAESRKGSSASHASRQGTPILSLGSPSGGFPLLLALTPEMASLDTEELERFFRKLRTAYARACQD